MLSSELRRLTAVWQDLARVERALTAAGRMSRQRDVRSLPAVVYRLGAVVTSHIPALGEPPESDWAAVKRDLAAAEQYITALVERLLWLLDEAVDVAGRLAGDADVDEAVQS